jgi:vesicle coat complex subunit
LKNDVRVFFCKYNDPIYVKLAKLEIMYRLARAENATEVLAELQEYANLLSIRTALFMIPFTDMPPKLILTL